MLAVSAQAGEFKTHSWPSQFIKQEIATLKVTMDVGYWITIKKQGDVIKMQQVDTTKFSGCRNFTVENNFAATLTSSIAPVSPVVVGGKYKTDFGPGNNSVNIDPGSNTVQICAYLENADMKNQTPKNNVHVANVKIYVIPQA